MGCKKCECSPGKVIRIDNQGKCLACGRMVQGIINMDVSIEQIEAWANHPECCGYSNCALCGSLCTSCGSPRDSEGNVIGWELTRQLARWVVVAIRKGADLTREIERLQEERIELIQKLGAKKADG